MANIPAVPALPPVSIFTENTERNIDVFVMRTEATNVQLTSENWSLTREMKRRAGRENLPTKIPMPRASRGPMILQKPAR